MCVYKGEAWYPLRAPGLAPSLWLDDGVAESAQLGDLSQLDKFTEDLRAGGRCVNWAQLGSSGAEQTCRSTLTGAVFWASQGLVSSLWGGRMNGCLYLARGALLIGGDGDSFNLLRSQPRSSLFLLVPTISLTFSGPFLAQCNLCTCSGLFLVFHLSCFPCRFLLLARFHKCVRCFLRDINSPTEIP